jgi:nitroreductase
MTSALNDQSLDQIFRSARTPNGWADRPVEDDTVREIYDLMKWGPTSANSSPARFVWVHSADGFACHRTSAATSPPRAARLARHEVFRVRSIATVKILSRPCRRGSGSSKVDQRPIVNPGRGEDISSIPLAVELHGRWHVMTPSIELRDGVCL